jgi:hypothetical protein
VSEASDETMHAAVERWARARGWWNEHNTAVPLLIEPWSIQWRDESMLVHTVKHARGRLIEEWHASPHAALVWALVLSSGPLRDGSTCKRCDGCTIRTIGCPACEGTGLADLTYAYAQHVLDAQPRAIGGLSFVTAAASGIGATLSARADGADPASIEALHVLADRLQPDLLRRADGLPRNIERETLGFHIAHLLAGSREDTDEAIEQLRRATTRLTAPD